MKFDGIEKAVVACELKRNANEVLVYQHTAPDRVRECYAPVGEECAKMAEGMIIETEILSTGELALYVHWPTEENYGCQLAKNEPGNSEPTDKLREMIKAKFAALEGDPQ